MTEIQQVVICYQSFVFIAVLSGALQGRSALNWRVMWVSLWTVTHFFIPWLMALQFGVIAAAYFLGRALARPF